MFQSSLNKASLSRRSFGSSSTQKIIVSPRRSVPFPIHAASISPSLLSTLQNTEPVDRLRFQAKLVFDHFDADGDGYLRDQELQNYLLHSSSNLGQSTQELHTQFLDQNKGRPVRFSEFTKLLRSDVSSVSQNTSFLSSSLPVQDVARFQYSSALTVGELGNVMAIFKLLDFDGDKRLLLDDLEKAEGIELVMFETKLEDADVDDDGMLTFEDFLTSYAKEKAAFLSVAIMAAHTAVMFALFNSPLDIIIKSALALGIVMRPQLITNPVIKIFNILKIILVRIQTSMKLGTA